MIHPVICRSKKCGGKLVVMEQGPGRCPPYRCSCVQCGKSGGITTVHAMAIMAARMVRMPAPLRMPKAFWTPGGAL